MTRPLALPVSTLSVCVASLCFALASSGCGGTSADAPSEPAQGLDVAGADPQAPAEDVALADAEAQEDVADEADVPQAAPDVVALPDAGPIAPDAAAHSDGSGAPDAPAEASGPCPTGTTCKEGWCVQPRVTDQCLTDADCPGQRSFCNAEPVGGICLGCGDDADCPDGFTCTAVGACAIACDVDDDCPTGTCYAAPGLCGQRRCSADSDCPAGTACLDGGQCGRVSCPDPCAPNPCDAPNRGVCSASGETFTCSCNPGFEADAAGNCVAPASGACSPGYACVAGRCADADAAAFQCAIDADCGAGRTCSAALPSGICTGCTTASDCPVGHDRCLAGRCLRSCASSAECHAGMRCNSGVCGQQACTSDGDCGPDHRCDQTATEPRCVRRTCQ
jgi:hypothetical protein